MSDYKTDEREARKMAARAARNLIGKLEEYVGQIGNDKTELGDIFEQTFIEMNIKGRIRQFKTAHAHLRAVFNHGDDDKD